MLFSKIPSDLFFSELTFDLVYTPKRINARDYPNIRDEKDLPILVSAIIGDVDVFITGDKDFSCIDIERPQIISPKDFSKTF